MRRDDEKEHDASEPFRDEDRPCGLSGEWLISAAEALAQGDEARWLDARGNPSSPTLPAALPIRWQEFSEATAAHRGCLLADLELLTQRLTPYGIDPQQRVFVFGDPRGGWGEDGRVSWMLRALGHSKVTLVDGGLAALLNAGATLAPPRTRAKEPGSFRPRHVPGLVVERDELQAGLESQRLAGRPLRLVDCRSTAEYHGATPHGEARGGHVPGASHLHFRELLDANGRLRGRAVLQSLLDQQTLTNEAQIVTYCSGGVRSAWLTIALRELSFHTACSYAGSMRQWSAGAAEAYPLIAEG